MRNIINKFSNTLLYSVFITAIVMLFVPSAQANPLLSLGITYSAVEILSLLMPIGIMGADAYSDTVLFNARAFITDEKNKRFNLKRVYSNVMAAFMKGQDYIPNLSAIKKSTLQTTEIEYLKKGTFSLTTDKSCTPTATQGGSGKVSVTWNKLGFTVRVSEKQMANNEVSVMRAFENDLYNREAALWQQFDQEGIDYLEANKSGVNSGQNGSYDATNDIMAIAAADAATFYNLVSYDMKLNNYEPQYMDIANTNWGASRSYYGAQGPANSTNTAFQFVGFDWYDSNLIIPGTIGSNAYASVHYIVPEGGVAMLTWNDPLNIKTADNGTSYWGTYRSLLHPEHTFDLYKYTVCADSSADGGDKQDIISIWEFTLNYAFAKMPIDTATETPIFKYGTLISAFVS